MRQLPVLGQAVAQPAVSEEWLRAARRAVSTADVDQKLAALRTAARHEFPPADINQKNSEIVRGYVGGPAT